MAVSTNRREFLSASVGAATALAVLDGRTQAQEEKRLKKALIVGKPTEENMKPVKEAGFDGVEAGVVSFEEAVAAKKAADGLGMKIHSVMRGWAEFNSEDAAKVQGSIDHTANALRAAKGYGADAVLLVPCRIGGMPMPQPWEFRVRFDEKTGHLTSVADGDNEKYKDYIAAHDRAHDTSQEAIRKLIPVAEETGVVIAVENVWNNLFLDPRHLANFVDSFHSKWVQVYFDIGNHVKYSPPEQWIAVLGKRIVKTHVKDFRLNPDGHGGDWAKIREGSINWPAVVKALKDVGYNGWMTIESGGLSMEEHSKRLDLIIAGE